MHFFFRQIFIDKHIAPLLYLKRKRVYAVAVNKEESEKIINLYYDDIYKFCVSRCGDASVAADITHDTFLVFLKKAEKLDNINLRAWLYKTASIEIKSYFKNHKAEIEFIPFQDCGDIEMPESSDSYMSEDEFEELLSKTQKKILSVLNEDEKKVFIKLYIEKKTVKTVSEETGLTPNNIYVKSHRLKNKAKKIISTTDLLINIIIFKIF